MNLALNEKPVLTRQNGQKEDVVGEANQPAFTKFIEDTVWFYIQLNLVKLYTESETEININFIITNLLHDLLLPNLFWKLRKQIII